PQIRFSQVIRLLSVVQIEKVNEDLPREPGQGIGGTVTAGLVTVEEQDHLVEVLNDQMLLVFGERRAEEGEAGEAGLLDFGASEQSLDEHHRRVRVKARGDELVQPEDQAGLVEVFFRRGK